MKDTYYTGRDPATMPTDAVGFLEAIAAGLPVTVARISPESGGIAGETFNLPGQREGLTAWVAQHEGRANLYYSLNAATGAERKGRAGKLAEADVTHIRGVAVDLDPRPGEPLDAEKGRLLETVAGTGNTFGEPSVIVDSGGGVQALWLLPAPLPATVDAKVAVKAQARGLCKLLGSDAVQSVDHLFRLPFTTNIPNAKKRAAGRLPAPASIHSWSGDRWRLDTLRTIAAPVADRGESADRTDWQDLGLDYVEVLEALGDPTALPEDLHSIAQHAVADYEKIVGNAANDRSACDYRIASWLIRTHGIIDPTKLARVTFAISPEKLTELRQRDEFDAERHCGRTIARALARNWADPDPHEFFKVEHTGQDIAGAGTGRRRGRDRFMSLGQIRAMTPPEFLIDRHLPKTGLALIYGDPGSFKSFLAFDMAMHVAHGLPAWHGDRIAPGEGCVLYIAGEGVQGYQKRSEAWNRAPRFLPEGQTSEAPFMMLPEAVNMMNSAEVDRLIEDIRLLNLGSPRMIVIDTVSRSIPGADENAQKDMTTFVAHCDRLRDAFGGLIVGVHHTSKTGTMRGSSVFHGQADAVFRTSVEKAKDGTAAGFVHLACEKQKDAPDDWRERYQMRTIEWTQDGKQQSSLVPIRAAKIEKSAKEARISQRWAEVVSEAMGDRDEAPWAGIWRPVADGAKARKLTGAETQQKVLEAVKPHLEGIGADVEGLDGQSVNVSMSKTGGRGGWIVRKMLHAELNDGGGEDAERS